MRLLRLFIGRNQRSNTNRSPVHRKKSKISRYKRALAEVEAIPAFSRYPEMAEKVTLFLQWGKRHLKKSDRFDWLVGILKRCLHLASTAHEDPYRARILRKFSEARIISDMHALQETFAIAFPEIQDLADERGCRPILDMPFHESRSGRLFPLTPDSVIEQLEELEEKYLADFMDQNRFCREGEKYLETHDGWVWFQIHPGRSEEEGRAMRHCGNVPSWTFGDYIYSLREPIEKNGEVFWKPHISITCNGLEFKEIKGFSNRKPPKDLHPHILDLLCQKKFRGFGQTGYRPSNDFHVCDLSLAHIRELYTRNPSFQQDHLKFAPEPLEQLREGWRWVFVRNIGVGGCRTSLNEIDFRELWALRGRRGWIILQESVDVGTRTIWVHHLSFPSVIGTSWGVRKGNICPDFLSEALDCLGVQRIWHF